MLVSMMDIRVMGMLVRQDFVAVLVHMRLSAIPVEVVGVLVMFVVSMWVRVLEQLVTVFVQVPLPYVQPNTDCHQRCRRPKQRRRHTWPDGKRDDHTEQRRDRKVSASARCAQYTESDHEQGQAQAVAEEPHQQAGADGG